jgi:hypothetical protein
VAGAAVVVVASVRGASVTGASVVGAAEVGAAVVGASVVGAAVVGASVVVASACSVPTTVVVALAPALAEAKPPIPRNSIDNDAAMAVAMWRGANFLMCPRSNTCGQTQIGNTPT